MVRAASTGLAVNCHVLPSHVSAILPLALLPTATHAFAEVHDTLARDVDCPPAGTGVGCHIVPFQVSASWPPRPAPTASHAVPEVHHTPLRPPPLSLSLSWMAHFLPFHRSARPRCGPCSPEFSLPTAVQADADVHETAVMSAATKLVSTWRGWLTHFRPFQLSASLPTASQNFAELHDTALRLDSNLGNAWVTHFLPSQRSAISKPTAVHALADVQDTPDRPVM